jgi:hypothetical protein
VTVTEPRKVAIVTCASQGIGASPPRRLGKISDVVDGILYLEHDAA